jgi:choline dehydrogenase-like flavoprotein
VLAIERGGWRDTSSDFAVTFAQDELRYMWRRALFQEPARETLTFRNNPSQIALPMRHLGSFLPASGVGGAGVHWNGQTWRFLPSDFVARSHNEQRYGPLPPDMTIQDWGVTYDELEPYYDKFEYLCGISGNVRLMLLSGIGQPYDVNTGQGVVGKNYAYQIVSSVDVFFDDKIMNPFVGAGALGVGIDDYNGDNFDHSGPGFIGGASSLARGSPIGVSGGGARSKPSRRELP